MEDLFKCIDGVYLPNGFEDFKDEIFDMEIYDTDIWVCTFPKSGTTWVQELAWLLMNNLDYKKANETLLITRFPFLESCTSMHWDLILEAYPKCFGDVENSLQYVKQFKGRRFIKTHLPWHLLPKQIQTGEKKPKIIYVTRHPKDVCVSFFHYFCKVYGFDLTFKEYCDLFIKNEVIYTPYWDHIASYSKNRHNILTLKYEDLKKDLSAEIKKIAKYLQIDYMISENEMEVLLKHLSFETMKNNTMVNEDDLIQHMKEMLGAADDASFIRKGKVGDYKNHFDAETETSFNNWIKRTLRENNFDLDKLPVYCPGFDKL